MSILTHFGNKNTRTATLLFSKVIGALTQSFNNLGALIVDFAVLRRVRAGNALGGGGVTAKYFFHGVGNFSHGCPCLGSLNGDFKQVAVAFGGLGNGIKGCLAARAVTVFLRLVDTLNLLQTN